MANVAAVAFEFECLVREVFERLGFAVTGDHSRDIGYDYVAVGHDLAWAIEVKYYRSERPGARLLEAAAARLAAAAKPAQRLRPMLAVSSVVPHELRWRLDKKYGVAIVDRGDLISSALKTGLDKLVVLLDETVQTDRDEYKSVSRDLPEPQVDATPPVPDTQGTTLGEELLAYKSGRKYWAGYEDLGERILRYLFEDCLYGWHKQKRTEDGLNRFDLVCRIRSDAAFWRFLVERLHSQYALFEFKSLLAITGGKD